MTGLHRIDAGRHRHVLPVAAEAETVGLARPAGTVLACLAVCVGVLAIAAAYALGRIGSPIATPTYWAGEVLLIAPMILRVVVADCTVFEGQLIVAIAAVTSYAVKVCYSPISFRFPDELQHYRTAIDLITAGNLDTFNPALPISPSYPGLELVTTSIAQLTGLSVFVSGLIVAGLAHLVTAVALFVFFEAVTASPRLATLAVVVYAANPHYQQFDSMFVYEVLGLAFLSLCLAAAARATTLKNMRGVWLGCAVVMGLMVVPTHHVTSYALISLLLVGALDRCWSRDRVGAHKLGGLLAVITTATVVWGLVFAPLTISYFQPVAQQLMDNVTSLFGASSASGSSPPQSGSTLDRWISDASVLLLLAGLIYGCLVLRRMTGRRAWSSGMAVASSMYLVMLAVRVVSADGDELYGRAMSFVFIPLSLIVSVAILSIASRWRTIVSRLLVAALLVTIFAGGITSGWPPAWERVPGPFQVSGYEASVGPQGVDAATWAGKHLPPYTNLAADLTNYSLFGTYGRQNSIRQVAPLFTSETYNCSDRRLVRSLDIRYLVSDIRLSEYLPASGAYFAQDPNAYRYTHPLTRQQLRKFDSVVGASRIYDGGPIVVYDLRGVSGGC